MVKRFGPTIAVVFAVLLGAGCGSGEGGDPSTVAAVSFNPSVTHAEYRQQANAICNEAKKEMVFTLQNRAKEEGKASALQIPPEAQTEIMLASMRSALDELREVAAPAEGKHQVEQFIDTFQESIDAIDEEGLHTTQEFEPVLLRIYRSATAYGLDGCGYGR